MVNIFTIDFCCFWVKLFTKEKTRKPPYTFLKKNDKKTFLKKNDKKTFLKKNDKKTLARINGLMSKLI